MIKVWQSEDGYVVVADQVAFPSGEGEGGRDLEALFNEGAWIVVWRAEGAGYWRATRSRRHAKPNLSEIRQMARWLDNPLLDDWHIAAHGGAAHERHEAAAACDPVTVAKAIYVAWQYVALDAIPAKVEYFGLDKDGNFPDQAINAWMRPGLALYRERRADLRKFLEELKEAA